MTGPDHRDDPLAPLRAEVGDDVVMAAAVADRLEAALRVAHAERRRAPSPWWRRPAALAPVALLVVVAFTATLVLRSEAPSAAVVLRAAENVTVVLPDGEIVVDPADGFEVPDGAVIEIGDAGTVTIDDVVIAEPARLSVVDGALVADVIATTTTPDRPDHLEPPPTTVAPVEVTTTTLPPPTTTAAPTTTRAPVDTTTTRAPDDRRDDERRDDRNDDDRNDDDRNDDDRNDDDRSDDDQRDDGRRDDRDGDPDDVAEVSIGLSLTRVDGGARVAWAVDGLADGWTVVVRRSVGRGDPTDLLADAGASGAFVDAVDDGRDERLRYRIVVLDQAGGVVAGGPVQSLRR